MALVDVMLANLAEGRVEEMFREALTDATTAFEEGRFGKATITLKVYLEAKEDSPWVAAKAEVDTSTPKRKATTVLAVKGGKLLTENTSNNASQPGLFGEDGEGTAEEPGNVVPMYGGKV